MEAICEHVLAQTAPEQGRDDDVAVLAVQLLGSAVGPLELTLPAAAEAVTLARHRLRAWLEENAPSSIRSRAQISRSPGVKRAAMSCGTHTVPPTRPLRPTRDP